MQFNRLVLEKRNGGLGDEEKLLRKHAVLLGIPVVYTNLKTVSRDFFEFHHDDIVAGSVPFMRHVFRNYKIDIAEQESYPEQMRHHLHRMVTAPLKLRDAKRVIEAGITTFIKPIEAKKFTGFVTCDSMDPRFNGAGNQTEVVMSSVVEFLCEWRVYVVNNKIVWIARAPHDNDIMITPDPAVINDCVNKYAGNSDGYVLDIGMLAGRRTALVEVNDGFSVGAYGYMPAQIYWDLITARWEQLLKYSKKGKRNDI